MLCSSLTTAEITAIVPPSGGAGGDVGVTVDVNWATFLARSDPVNEFDVSRPATIPDVWLEGSFMGNGMIGAQVLVCPGGVCRQSLLLGTDPTPPKGGP